MTETMFCLTCMSWEPVSNGGHMIIVPPFEDEPADVEFCDGPFTYTEPPETNDLLVVPDPEEMEVINQDAINFMEEA